MESIFELLPQINCFLPIKGEDGGNYSLVYFNDGTKKIVKQQIKTFLKNIARYYAKDIGLIRKQSKDILGYSKDLPLLITPLLVCIPVKIREASYKDEGTLGYAIFSAINKIIPISRENKKGKLVFKDSLIIQTLNTPTKLRQKFNEARDLIQVEEEKLYKGRKIEDLLLREILFTNYN